MKDNDFLNLIQDSGIEVLTDIPETGWIDTGAYILNALVSGSIYRGVPSNRSIMFAGAPSAGKTFLMLSCVKTFLDDNEKAQVVYFDSEFALEKSMLGKRGIDPQRFHIVQVDTLQDFRTKIVNFLNNYEKSKSKTKVMLCLDSLSNLPTKKEVEDAASGSDARDMTKAQVIRSIFRTITNKLGQCDIPLYLTNHIYSSMDIYSPVVISGGGGAQYAASTIITLNKSKAKDGTDVYGNMIKATTYKSRYSKENQNIVMLLDFNTGLDRYYGLLDLAEKYDIIKKVGNRYELPDGSKVWGKDINGNPEKYYTKEILDLLDEAAHKEYSLGAGEDSIDEILEELELDTTEA